MLNLYTFIIIAAILFVVGYPLLKSYRSKTGLVHVSDNESGALNLRKESLYATIKELDFDFRTGKLSVEDYEELRDKYRERAMGILLEIENEDLPGSIETELENEIKARRNLEPGKDTAEEQPVVGTGDETRFCPNCGRICSSGDSFCSYCGKELSGHA